MKIAAWLVGFGQPLPRRMGSHWVCQILMASRKYLWGVSTTGIDIYNMERSEEVQKWQQGDQKSVG